MVLNNLKRRVMGMVDDQSMDMHEVYSSDLLDSVLGSGEFNDAEIEEITGSWRKWYPGRILTFRQEY